MRNVQKRVGERRRRDNLRRRDRRRVGKQGFYKCHSCKGYFYRYEMQVHHTSYKGLGKSVLLCIPCHEKRHKRGKIT